MVKDLVRVPGLIGMKCFDLMLYGKSTGSLPSLVLGTGWEYTFAACLNE